jgi:urocanate hydratase
MGGVARRRWARNSKAIEVVKEYNSSYFGESQITLPYLADEDMVKTAVRKTYESHE